ncbi:hypothetical protein CCAX7_003280 [Capsulimonas corticalis]|uniref:Uncharacterized protein n=1 Tax=Capsulimonas corticalis TaxID=2219043 RepID=A0A402CS71_9BACT|nr:hypothetical protein [Capsulimonas corticalis]BDI28277.1 hypothetical protein CCAX7_003280 [Capsulimonas corticalis]
MNILKKLTMPALAATMAITALAPTAVMADSSQKDKNNWRNGAIGAGAIALYGLHNHDAITSVLGVGAAAYSAKKYEDARKQQSQESSDRARYHRSGSSSNYNGGGNYGSDRKYYWYDGHRYYKDNNTGQRVQVY